MTQSLFWIIYVAGWIVASILLTFYIKKSYNAENLATAIFSGVIGGGFWPFISIALITGFVFLLIMSILSDIIHKLIK